MTEIPELDLLSIHSAWMEWNPKSTRISWFVKFQKKIRKQTTIMMNQNGISWEFGTTFWSRRRQQPFLGQGWTLLARGRPSSHTSVSIIGFTLLIIRGSLASPHHLYLFANAAGCCCVIFDRSTTPAKRSRNDKWSTGMMYCSRGFRWTPDVFGRLDVTEIRSLSMEVDEQKITFITGWFSTPPS